MNKRAIVGMMVLAFLGILISPFVFSGEVFAQVGIKAFLPEQKGEATERLVQVIDSLKEKGFDDPTLLFGSKSQMAMRVLEGGKQPAPEQPKPEEPKEQEPAPELPGDQEPAPQQPAPQPTPANDLWVLGYTVIDYQGDQRSHNSVVKYGSSMSHIAPFTYRIDAKGNLTNTTPLPTATVNEAKKQGVKPLVLIHNYDNGFDKDTARAMMKSPQARANLINQLVKLIEENGYAGVNVDIEGIYVADRPLYSLMLKEMKEVLGPKGYLLTVAIPAKTSDDLKNAWSGGYDYKEIGKYADKILLMTYDQYWIGGPPGPVASIIWTENVIKYAVKEIDPKKLLLGLATYGYDWSEPGKGKALSYPQALAKAKEFNATVKWHDRYQVPYFFYKGNDGKEHQVWFENEESARIKLQLVSKYGLGGVGVWKLGNETARYWKVLDDNLGK